MSTKPPPATAAPYRRAATLAHRFVLDLMEHKAFEAAASIAFWFFLSLVPLLVLVGFLVGQVARLRGVDALVGPLLDLIPGTAEGLVRAEVERMAGASVTSLAPLGVIGFLWTASSGLHNLMDVFETAAGARARPWWKQRSIALGWVVLGLATACTLAWLILRLDATIQVRDSPSATATTTGSTGSTAPPPPRPDRPATHPPSGGPARGHGALQRRVGKALRTPREPMIAGTLLLLAGMALLAGFYRLAVERPPGVRRRVWPGVAAAVGSWLAVSWGFGAYVVSIADYAFYYGSLAAVAVLLVWLYLTSLALVLGAEVNVQLERVWAQAAAPKPR